MGEGGRWEKVRDGRWETVGDGRQWEMADTHTGMPPPSGPGCDGATCDGAAITARLAIWM